MPIPPRAAHWLKQHGAGERSFGRALRKYFQEQADRVADNVRENFPGGVSPEMVPLIFRADDEDRLLQPVLKRNLSGLMLVGARGEARAARRRLEGKAFADDFDAPDLPPETLAAIRRSLTDLESQDYWREIQQTTATRLAGIIEAGIQERLSPYAMSMQIREHLGGFEARKRALKIARTETGGCLNAGHVAYAESLADDGVISGREWLTISDRDVRQDHQLLASVVVPARDGMFNVGGSLAPYPGHFSLPAAQRINCRCTVVSVFNEAYLPSGGGSDPSATLVEV